MIPPLIGATQKIQSSLIAHWPDGQNAERIAGAKLRAGLIDAPSTGIATRLVMNSVMVIAIAATFFDVFSARVTKRATTTRKNVNSTSIRKTEAAVYAYPLPLPE